MTDSKAPKTYTVNEIFYSLQGEGMRAGTANVFVRFSGCNMRCRKEAADDSPGGFDCDTEFVSGRRMTLEEIHTAALNAMCDAGADPRVPGVGWQVLTGGEPGLQVDRAYCEYMHTVGWKLAIETNGSIELPHGKGRTAKDTVTAYALDWITVSPKVAEHAVRQLVAHEVKYVRGAGQGIPKPTCKAQYQLISPAFNGMEIDERALAWCIDLAKQNPDWRLSVQAHKAWRIR